ncbi:MAG: inositol monophosphatase family protein, partial [Alphaproteobacteria bacterium]
MTAILREVAAEEVMPRFRDLAEHEIRAKDSGELVTVADVAAERQITRRLRDLLPGSQVVGEEATAEDPGLLDKFAQEDDWIWVIDPIDGTANFAAGKPVFALMVALVRRGETGAGWILDPNGPRCATAERGGGAWLDAARLVLGPPPPPAELRGT